MKSRVLHTANGTSSFQFDRIALCGDVHPQRGPAVKVKYLCKEGQRNVDFVQIRMLSYVLIAKPGRMQNVSDLPIHNSNTTWIIGIATGFVTGVPCHFATTLT